MSDFRAIRALYDEECITVYQAYSKEIAEAAVREQKLSASPAYGLHRMTWIKPSWCWMMYRCGYSYKDERQVQVLAIRIKHENFHTILRQARLAHKSKNSDEKAGGSVVVQWDPERSPKIGRLEYRSLQVGIPSHLVAQYVDEWIESIEDVTDAARGLKERLDRNPSVGKDELVESGLVPVERLYEVPRDIYERLEMG